MSEYSELSHIAARELRQAQGVRNGASMVSALGSKPKEETCALEGRTVKWGRGSYATGDIMVLLGQGFPEARSNSGL